MISIAGEAEFARDGRLPPQRQIQRAHGAFARSAVDAVAGEARSGVRGVATVVTVVAHPTVDRQVLDVERALVGVAAALEVAIRRAVGDEDDIGIALELGEQG